MALHEPYPVFLDLADQPVLLVGGGTVGLRKARGVLAAGGRVTVVSREFSAGWAELAGASVHRIQEAYRAGASGHVGGGRWRLVFAAANDAKVNSAVADDAAAANIFCCRCDGADGGDFSGGAVHRQGGITLAVSTKGASPILARKIRDVLAGSLDPHFAQWAELLTVWRGQVRAGIDDPEVRRDLLQRIAGPDMEQTLRADGNTAAQELFARWLAEAGPPEHEVPRNAG